MKRVFSLMVIVMSVLVLSPVLTSPVSGWAFGLHSEIARDALEGLGWTEREIDNIPWFANEVDLPIVGSPHGDDSCHRVEKYQRLYEEFGGEICTFAGAEWHASEHLREASEYYAAGDILRGRRHLGYAIHFIEDCVCPSHIFPLEEDLIAAHMNFELYTLGKYLTADDWSALVRDAQVERITSPEDLRLTLISWADEIFDMFQPPRCSYRTPNGTLVGTLSWDDSSEMRGWSLSDQDIGITMEKAASIIKGAVNYVCSPKPPVGFIHGVILEIDSEQYYMAGPADGSMGEQDVPGHYWITLSSRWMVGLHYNTGPFDASKWWSTDAPAGSLLYIVIGRVETWSDAKAEWYSQRGYVHYHELVKVSDGITLHPTKVVWLKHIAVRHFNLDGGPHPELAHDVEPGVDSEFINNYLTPYP